MTIVDYLLSFIKYFDFRIKSFAWSKVLISYTVVYIETQTLT